LGKSMPKRGSFVSAYLEERLGPSVAS